MNIQRFVAPTAREALAKARAAFGDETLILSNRQVPDGVEVMAATEAALAMIDGSSTAPLTVSAAQPAAVVVVAPVPAPALDIGVEADTEQLAMSTLSFQDYVRERMLRRQHEAAMPATTEQPMPALAPAPAPVLRAAPVAVPVPAAQVAPVVVAAVEASPAPQAPTSVIAELQAMKDMMDERFSALAWLGYARQDPIQSNLMLKLVRAGYSPGLARSVLEAMPASLEAGDAVRWLMQALEARLGNTAPLPSIPEEGGVFALIGATGVGKTTSAAKLAAMGAQLHGAAGVGLITLDTQRAGAHEQLRAHGRSLGVVAHLAHDRAALQDLLNLLAGKKVVIIDSAGVAPHDPRRRDLLDLLDIPNIKRVLVLNAGAHGDTLEDIAIAFKIGGTREAIVSKLDEAAKIGPVLDTLMRHEFTVRGISNGQRIPDDWKTGDARGLVRASMHASQRSAFDPKTADLPCYFSPVGLGA
ncbi:flagellar biosynthesis protein FlhF [Variovorax sp. PAMC 28711]|uniref:flagellar biosynthesis protein FlhF n=1 Tax=Variovorax sp. PAMC 28711 TaxID=1795631 RepID=UPI00078BF459|nr:flagellar biosynthesis protein FlhF [Variovorax sp. PAMC 28711]AMM25017.1 flagellar biosynthesis protein FlhF [Variovorax sp. PAMC 28711]